MTSATHQSHDQKNTICTNPYFKEKQKNEYKRVTTFFQYAILLPVHKKLFLLI